MKTNLQYSYQPHDLTEGLEANDLEKLISNRITIDEYKSKMGSDDEIVVIGFYVSGKEPALDLVSFVEKSYNWVVDADVSSGEIDDGKFIVFVEIEREPSIAEQILELLSDLENLTEYKTQDWQIKYYKSNKRLEPNIDSLSKGIPSTPMEYRQLNKNRQDDIDKLKTAAGVKVDTAAPKNDFTESLRVIAGIR